MKVTVNVRPLRALRQALNAGSGDPALAGAYRQMGRNYLQFASTRFGNQENAGWQALKPSTVKQRIKQGFSGPAPILRRTGEVKAALAEGAPGNLMMMLPHGVRTGYGGNAVHSLYPGQKGSPKTIAQIAAWNNAGTGRVPARPIIVAPTTEVVTTGLIPPLGRAVKSIIARSN